MKIQVPINGISTSPIWKDGDTISLVNLRNKAGALEPIPPRKITKTLSDTYDLVFVHQLPSTGENWIGVKGNTVYLDTGITQTSLCSASSLTSITQIGNVLNLVDSTGIKHLFWYDNEYKLISTAFDGTQEDIALPAGKIELRTNATYDPPTVYLADSAISGSSSEETVAEVIKGLFAKAISVERKRGYLKGFVLACTAYELFDGSVILHSNPVLIGQPVDARTRYRGFNGLDRNYDSNPIVLCYGVPYGINYKTNSVQYDLDEYKSFLMTTGIDSSGMVPHYLVKAGVSTGGSTIISYPNPSNLISNNYWDLTEGTDPNIPNYQEGYEDYPAGTKFNWIDHDPVEDTNYIVERTALRSEHKLPFANLMGYMDAHGSNKYPAVVSRRSELQVKIENSLPEVLKPLVRSINVYITQEVLIYKDENYKRISRADFSAYGSVLVDNYLPDLKTDEEIKEELMSQEKFYKVKEIFPNDIAPGEWVTVDLKDKLGENLRNQEKLQQDPLSHHQVIPNKQYTYNSRLHVADYKRILSRGWPLPYLKQTGGLGQFIGEGSFYTENGVWYCSVELKTDTGISKIVRYKSDEVIQNPYEVFSALSPIISYPDSRAKKITLYRWYDTDGDKYEQKLTFELTASESHNFAYYISSDLKPIIFPEQVPAETPEGIPEESQREQMYRNGLKVSQVNNPFNFPDENTYLIGTGTIRNLSSNAMRISEGQFGQFPLYVLTTENIYALNVGQEVLYTTQSPVSNESPTSDVICQTPFGVIFIGKRGLYIINGQQVELLTPFLETTPDNIQLSLPTVEKCPKIGNLKTWNDNFIDYLKDVKEIVYDSKESEIILLNTGKDYNFVYNIPSKMWYQQTEDISSFVKNVFPELFGVQTTSVKDFSQPKTTTVGEVTTIDKALISLITRPINFGSLEYKRIEQLILRLRLKGEDIIFLTNTSRDDINFDLDKGMILADGNYKDINLGRFIKKYRNVIVMLTAEVESDTKIYLLDANVEPGYNKMM